MKRYIIANAECIESGRRLAELGEPWWKHTGGLVGIIGERNAYVCAYPEVHGKPIAELEIGEGTVATYRLSGTTGHYKVVRVEDGPPPEDDERAKGVE